jgi:hypothetical protein
MSEPRPLPLRVLARPGIYGNVLGTPGVILSIHHPVVLVSVIARKGKNLIVAEALKVRTSILLRAHFRLISRHCWGMQHLSSIKAMVVS